jgi:hypothetical protein
VSLLLSLISRQLYSNSIAFSQRGTDSKADGCVKFWTSHAHTCYCRFPHALVVRFSIWLARRMSGPVRVWFSELRIRAGVFFADRRNSFGIHCHGL